MKRLMSGALLLGAVTFAAACNNVTGDLAGGPTRITVDHNPLVITRNATAVKLVVQNYDDQGTALLSDAHIVGAPTGPVIVVLDTAFQQHGVHYGTQFNVSATGGFGPAFVTFTDAGLTTPADTVLVVPDNVNPVVTISNPNPTIGDEDTLTLTEPSFRFDTTDGSGVVLVDSTRVVITGMSADSTQLFFTAPDTLLVTGTGTIVNYHNSPITIPNTHIVFFGGTPAVKELGLFSVQTSENLVIP